MGVFNRLKRFLFSKNRKIGRDTSVIQDSTVVVRGKGIESYEASSCAADTMDVCGYTFEYIQDLIPACDLDGKVRKYYPQDKYDNKANLELLRDGTGAFCRFSIQADNRSGVYLWVVDGEIIYIGETTDLKRRFNAGYGNISPRNCYVGGQSTNCKMNKAVLDHFERGQVIGLYFYQTMNYKSVKHELLRKISTKYNVKDN